MKRIELLIFTSLLIINYSIMAQNGNGLHTKPINTIENATQEKDMMVRIAVIEIYPEYIESYKEILKEEAAASVEIEPGVISIFPMYEEENPTQIKILEIYANRKAYEAHLQTPHFIKYKTSTQKMVKSLKLIDMDALDSTTMQTIFNKLN